MKMNASHVAEKLREIQNAKKLLEEYEEKVRSQCTHRYANDERSTRPTGGGFAQCIVCKNEVD